MKNMKCLVDIQDYSAMIFQFIGTEEYHRFLSVTNESKESGFMHGLALSAILMESKCKKYYFCDPDDEEMKKLKPANEGGEINV